MAGDMFEVWDFGKSALQLTKGQIESVVIHILASVFEGLKKDLDLTEVPARVSFGAVRCSARLTRCQARLP